MFNNVLVLAPHTDDGEIGAGGLISKLTDIGSNIFYVAFSSCEESVPEEFEKDVLKYELYEATSTLGIKRENVSLLNYKVRRFPESRQAILDDLIKIRSKRFYDLVLLPSTYDIHQDHKTISEEGIRAFKGTSILGYELPWNQLSTPNSFFVKLTERNIDNKISALKCYKSQYGRRYCNEEYIRSLAHIKGAMVNADLAETYEAIRFFL